METKFYFLYKTTNLINNKFYIGVHETYNLDDGYLGSGKRFKNSLYYHGKENFKREILEYFDNSKSMYDKESEIVNEEFLKNPKCLNIGIGGKGGFTLEQCRLGGKIAGGLHSQRYKYDEKYRLRCNNQYSTMFKRLWENGKFDKRGTRAGFYNKSHTDETKQKMSESSKGMGSGKSNSQYGTCWITDGTKNKKIKKEEIIPSGFTLGRTI